MCHSELVCFLVECGPVKKYFYIEDHSVAGMSEEEVSAVWWVLPHYDTEAQYVFMNVRPRECALHSDIIM